MREIQWTAKRGSSRRRTLERLQVFSLSASFGKIILNPRHELWSKFFRWMNSLLGEGYKKELEIEDLFEARKEDESEVLGSKLEE